MYLQIMENIKQLVIRKDWPAETSLPSIRELAVSLRVSVITVKRAYQELEHEGVIYTRRGKGSFVADRVELASEQKQAELMEHLQNAIRLAQLLGMSHDKLLNKLKALLNK